MGKRQQIRKTVFKNPKAWYNHEKYVAGYRIYLRTNLPLKTQSGWQPSKYQISDGAYYGLVKKALIDCGELVSINRGVWDFRPPEPFDNEDRVRRPPLVYVQKQIVFPYGEIGNLSKLIEERNETLLSKYPVDPRDIVLSKRQRNR